MNATAKCALTAGLCVLAAWAGGVLARRDAAGSAVASTSASTSVSTSETPHPVRTAHPAAAPASPFPESRQLVYRRTLARCETADLWSWLQEQQDSRAPFFDSVLGELLDRLGSAAAIETSLALPDPEQRRRLSDWLLCRFSQQDLWSAFQIYQDHRSKFDPNWGSNVAADATLAACAISADKAVEVMKLATLPDPVAALSPTYPPDFDFRKVMDYLANAPALPALVPFNLRSAWAYAAPAEAAAWFAAHPAISSPYGKAGDYALETILSSVANSNQSGRAEAFRIFATFPAADLDESWQHLGRDSQANVAPPLLEAATAIGYRDVYLASSLLGTRDSEALPDSWAGIPPGDRAALLDLALEQWTALNPTPVAAKAREHWRAAIEKQWAGMKP